MPHRALAADRTPARAAPPTPLPHDPLGMAVMLDPLTDFEPDSRTDDDTACARAWSAFETYLLGGLRDQWIIVTTAQHRGDADVLARSRLHLLTLTVDIAGRAHVCVTRRSDLSDGEAALAARTLDATASVIFERLARRWSLRVRTGPFSSAPWRDETAA